MVVRADSRRGARNSETQFRKVNNDCVLGYGVGRMPAQDKAEHPDRSATRLNHKSSQRNFENPRKLLNTGFDVHPRSLQAHRFDLHFANRPTAIPGRKYQENATCKALKTLQLNDNLDYNERKNASYPFLCRNFSCAQRSEKTGGGQVLAIRRRIRRSRFADRTAFAKTSDAMIDIGNDVGARS